MNATSQIRGLKELNGKIAHLKNNFDGRPVAQLALKSARVIAAQAKRNARVGPTGAVAKNIVAHAGRKAFQRGAVAVARAKWRGTGAVLEEWGTKDVRLPGKARSMRIPLSKLGASAAGFSKAGNAGLRGKRGATVRGGMGTGGFGYAFAKKIKGMKGTRFFENAVEQKMPEATKVFMDGIPALIQESIR